MAGRTSAASAGGWSTFGAWASKTPSARASWTSSAWPSSPASSSPPSARHPCRHRWTWPSTWCSAPSTTPEVSASSPPRASRPPPGTSVPGPARARSSSATTASPCTSKVLTTTPNASSPPWDVPPGRTSTTASSAHSDLAPPHRPGQPNQNRQSRDLGEPAANLTKTLCHSIIWQKSLHHPEHTNNGEPTHGGAKHYSDLRYGQLRWRTPNLFLQEPRHILDR